MERKDLIKNLERNNFPKKIIKAFAKIKREKFVPDNIKYLAYEDVALPLLEGATISQPYTIAFMLNLLQLEENQKILEIGSGSGYVLALISSIIKKGKIYGIEIIKSLAEKSKKDLRKDKKIIIINQDGSKGLPEKSPFDRILISAATQEIPNHLLEQLKNGGILVAPVKNSIFKIKKQDSKLTKKEFPGFVFVPLIKNK